MAKNHIVSFTVIAALIRGYVTLALAAAFTPALLENEKAEGQSQFMTGIRGTCDEMSYIALGPVGSDISQNRHGFFCDAAVLIFFDSQHRHVMINFVQQDATQHILAFAGFKAPDGIMMNVDKVYFEPGKPTFVDDGACKLVFANRHMTRIFCGGTIDADGQRTVASIVFNASPGQ